MIVEMCQGNPPLANEPPVKALQIISTEGIEFPLNNPESWSAELNEFIGLCLTADNFNRPTAEELLNHPITDPTFIPSREQISEVLDYIEQLKLNKKSQTI